MYSMYSVRVHDDIVLYWDVECANHVFNAGNAPIKKAKAIKKIAQNEKNK